MRKIIFLDLDGVFVTRKHNNFMLSQTRPNLSDNFGMLFDPDCVANFSALIAITKADIVISSSWRVYGGLQKMQDLWKFRNLPGNVIDITPDLDRTDLVNPHCRGKEIGHWMNIHRPDRFVIIDDDSDMLDSQMANLVHTNFDFGFTKFSLQKAIKILE